MKEFGERNLDVLQNIEFGIVAVCLREIQKSIPRWSRQGGRRGYLDFVSQYLP